MASWVLTKPQRRQLTTPPIYLSNKHKGGAGVGGVLSKALTFWARFRWLFKIASRCPNVDGIRI